MRSRVKCSVAQTAAERAFLSTASIEGMRRTGPLRSRSREVRCLHIHTHTLTQAEKCHAVLCIFLSNCSRFRFSGSRSNTPLNHTFMQAVFRSWQVSLGWYQLGGVCWVVPGGRDQLGVTTCVHMYTHHLQHAQSW